jgi:hypothetical protein
MPEPRVEPPILEAGVRGVRVAASLVAAEGLALFGFGCWLGYETLTSTTGNTDIAHGTTAYFMVLGLLVLGVSAALARRHGWAAGPSIFCQLLAFPIAWYMLTAGFWLGAVPLAVVAVVVLVSLISPATREVLGR